MTSQEQHSLVDVQLQDQDVVLDGTTYRRCTFTRCRLIYQGGEMPMFYESRFVETEWAFGGAAMRTVGFLNMLYHTGAKQIVDSTIKEIRAKPKQPKAARKRAASKKAA